MRDDGFGRHLDRLAVEPDIALVAECVEQSVHRLARHRSAAARAERALDRDVRGGCDEGRPVDATGCDGGERGLEQHHAFAFGGLRAPHDLALEGEATAGTREGVADATRGIARLGQRLTSLPRAAKSDHGRRDVFASVGPAGAIAFPVALGSS